MKKLSWLLILCLVIWSTPSYAVDKLFSLSDFQGLASNPDETKIDTKLHPQFNNVYVKDGNIQVIKGRNRLNSTAHADTTVNGLFYYEKPSLVGNRDEAEILLHMDTSALLDSVGGHTVVLNNDAAFSTTSKFGAGSAIFDGTTDWLEVADSDDFDLASNNFTIECQFRLASNVTCYLWTLYKDSNDYIAMYRDVGDAKIKYVEANDGEGTLNMTTTSTFGAGAAWHDITITRNGNIRNLYVDGVREATSSWAKPAIDDDAKVLIIGASDDTGVNSLDGYIDEFYIDNGKAWYTGTSYPVPTEAYSVSYDSTQNLIVAESDDIVTYDLDGTNRTVILSGQNNDSWEFTQVNTALYMQSIANGQYKWYGSGTAVKNSLAPTYQFLEEYKGVLFALKDRNLRFSNAIGLDETDNETWTATDAFTVGVNQYVVSGLKKARNSLLIFTPSSVQELTGFGDTFELRNLSEGVGCISNSSIVVDSNGDIIFFAGILGVYKLNLGGQLTDTSKGVEIDRTDTLFTNLSAPLKNIFKGTDSNIDLDPSDYTSAHAYYDLERDLYFLYIDKHCFIYSNISKSWSYVPATQMVASTYAYSTNLVQGKGYIADNKGFLYENWTGYETGIESGTVTGKPTSSTSTTLVDSTATFNTTDDGLTGLWVYVDNENGEYRQITSNTATELTVSPAWDVNPYTADDYYIAYIIPEWQTKAMSISELPKETILSDVYLIHNKSASSQDIELYSYLNRDITIAKDSYIIDLTTNYVDKRLLTLKGYWGALGFKSYVYNTSNTIVPPIDILSIAIRGQEIKEK